MHSRHVTGSPLRDEGTDKKANGPQPAKAEKPKKEEKEKGWTTVERAMRAEPRGNLLVHTRRELAAGPV